MTGEPIEAARVESLDYARAVGRLFQELTGLVSRNAVTRDAGVAALTQDLVSVGRVEPQGVAAIPYLSWLAARGVPDAARILEALGWMASSHSWSDELPDGLVRDTVASQLAVIVPVLSHEDVEVRRAAVYAVGQCRSKDRGLDALLSRWASEEDPRVRGDLLFALALTDSEAADEAARSAVGEEDDYQVRVSALLVIASLNTPWTEPVTHMAFSLVPFDRDFSDSFWTWHPGELHAGLTNALATEPDRKSDRYRVLKALHDRFCS